MQPVFLLRRVGMQYQRYLWLIPLLLLGGGMVSSVQADSGQLKRGGLSVTAAPGIGELDVDFTITQTSLLSTYTSGPPTPPGADTTFDGMVDFGDGSTGSGIPLAVVSQQQIQRRGDQYVFAVSQRGVVSHTYPAVGTYTAEFENCCQGVFKLTSSRYSLSFYTDAPPDDVIIKRVTVTVGPPGCEEPTFFKQLDCLLTKLLGDVEGANELKSRAVLRNRLLNGLKRAIEKKAEAENLCGLGNEAAATTAMAVALDSMKTFIDRVSGNEFLDILGLRSQFLALATPIRDIMQTLADTGVCQGSNCLPDPPQRAIQCEVDQLLDVVAQQATDAKIAEQLANKLDKISQVLEKLTANCDANNLKKATGNVKKMRTTVKNLAGQVTNLERRGKIPASLIAALRNGINRLNTILDNLSTNGVCQ